MNSLSQLYTTKGKSFMTVNQISQTVIYTYILPSFSFHLSDPDQYTSCLYHTGHDNLRRCVLRLVGVLIICSKPEN